MKKEYTTPEFFIYEVEYFSTNKSESESTELPPAPW